MVTTTTVIKRLAVLPSGRTVYAGDHVTDTTTMKVHKACGIRVEDGDRYLKFADGHEALVVAGSAFWRKYSGGAHIHLR